MAQLIPGDRLPPAAPRLRPSVRIILPAAALLCCLLAAGTAWPAPPAQPPITVRAGTIRILADGDYYDTLTTLIAGAGQRIDLAMFVFKTGEGRNNRPAALIRDLAAARQRGVEVRVILEDSGHDPGLNRTNQETAKALIKAGVAVFFDSPNRTTHAKLAVIDRRYCLVGSHNLTQSALKYNHEFSLLLDNPALAEEILVYMETIIR